jgi:glycosyltransferase involved in cell wall biosynthesis
MIPEAPKVSVVIPTFNRPQLVIRAVRSVLAQTLRTIEVIVVQDGPNARTLQALAQITDSRLKVHVLPENVGSGAAYNAGVAHARAKWVAFLDDDDEFLPRKLELQLAAAQRSSHRYPIVLCHIIGRAKSGDRVWPRRVPRPGEPISEWLFCRGSPFFGEGLVQSDMVFTHRELLEQVPVDGSLPEHDDIDWSLRAVAVAGAGVEFAPTAEPLAIWYLDEDRPRMSLASDWRFSLSWVAERQHLITPRACASFLLTWVGSDMARQKCWEAFWPLLRAAFRHGNPTVIDVLVYIGHWALPERLKRFLAARLGRRRTAGQAQG